MSRFFKNYLVVGYRCFGHYFPPSSQCSSSSLFHHLIFFVCFVFLCPLMNKMKSPSEYSQDVGGSSAHRAPPNSHPPQMRISLSRHDLLGEERWLTSKEKDQEPFPQWAFIGFSLDRNTGKVLSGSKDQTIVRQ